MKFNLPLNIVYDRTLNNCPECGSDKVSHSYFIHIKPTNEPFIHIKPTNEPPRKEHKCKSCGFKSEYRFELLNRINRRTEKIDKILDK